MMKTNMQKSSSTFLFTMLLSLNCAAGVVPASAVLSQAKEVKDSVAIVGLGDDFVVKGTTKFDSHFLAANTIIFEPGAKLVFSSAAYGNRNELIIATKKLIVKDKANPGVITWEQPSSLLAAGSGGQAASGAHGVGSGSSGAAGANGSQGARGHNGKSAPDITVFFMGVDNGVPTIDFGGATGGKGGAGQKGGDGGIGQKGKSASQTLIGCKNGPGHGGNGGNGGNGGVGGVGGTGGDGGTVRLVSTPGALPSLTQIFRVKIDGGDGGLGGDGGAGGNAGLGGDAGEPQLPYCTASPNYRGGNGTNGQLGITGSQGIKGTQGDLLTTSFTEEQLKSIFGI